MKLSIVTVCYNQPDILDTIASVVAQTWRDFEWIVVDGGSTDGTLEILRRYEKDMTVLISEKDSGIYNAMNKGLRLAKGERVLFLNGGDSLYSSQALADVFARLPGTGDADVVYGDLAVAFPDGSARVERFPSRKLDREYFINRVVPHPASFIRRSLFERFSEYDESFRVVSDWAKWIEFASGGCRYAKVDVMVSCFKQGGISTAGESPAITAEREAVLKKYFTAAEVAAAKRRVQRRKRYAAVYRKRLFGIPLLTLRHARSGNAMTSVLGVPVLKRRPQADGTRKTLLFGFIPVGSTRFVAGASPEFVNMDEKI